MAMKLGSVPAPVGGLNAYDSLIAMPQIDAPALVNWVPQAYGCLMRLGYKEHATGLGADVRSLIPYHGRSGLTALYGFAADKMFECSAPGAVGAPLLTGLVSSIWEGVSMATPGGTQLLCFSGEDDGIWIGDAGLQRLVLGDGIVNATWKNVDPKNLICPTTHQARVWAVEKGTTQCWYLPPNQVYGVATKFDFGPLFKLGGTVVGLTTWTVDDGDGSDDNLVIVSSMGEVAVYAGTDPSSISTWGLRGVYYMGPPVTGARFFDKVAGDVKFMTEQGLVSLNTMLTSTKTNPAEDTTEATKVQQPLSEAATTLKGLFGWQTYYCPQINLLFINIPSVTVVGNIQFVENVINKGWTQFEGYDASCFVTYNSKPFFGSSDGKVYQGWTGFVDNATVANPAGVEIEARAQQAYSYLDAPVINKQVGMYRPIFVSAGEVTYGSAIAYDFLFKTPMINFTPSPAPVARWDSALWDRAIWGGSLKTQRDWSMAEGMGVAASICMVARSKSETLWVTTDYTFISGGAL